MPIRIEEFLLFILLGGAMITDIRSMRIPNALTAGGGLAGLAVHSMEKGWHGLLFSASGVVCGFGLLLLLYWIGALGAGDVKLFAAIGALTGAWFVMKCLLYSILFAGVAGIVVLLFRLDLMRRGLQFFQSMAALLLLKERKELVRMKKYASLRFPFMYAVLPAAVTSWLEYFR